MMTSPRRRRSGPRALVLLLGLAACRGAGPTTTPTPGPTPVEVPPAPRVDPELAKIADAIDPGRIEPLLTAMPPWLSRALQGHVDADADPTAIQDEAREALAEYERRSGEGGGGSLPAFLALGRAAYLGERLLLAGRDDPELLVILERAYTILQNPFFTAPKGFFQVSFQMIVEAAARSGVVKEQSEVAELITFLQTAFQRARPLRQRSAALILRNHPEHPAVSDVLLHLADSASDDQDHVRAVELTRVAIARADPPIGRHWGALANRCAYALDVPCAKEAREKVRAWTPPDEPKAQKAQEERLRYNDEVIARAEEVLALADKDDLESTLRRAHLLILLARTNDAERLYEALRDRYPRDARPHAGLAKVLFQRNFDFYGAIPLVEAGRGLDHRDKDFFEVSLGLASARLMGEVIPRASAGEPVAAALEPFLRDVRDDARGWSKFEPGRGALLMAMIDDIAKILPTALGGDVSKSKPTLRRLLADLDRVRVANPEVADAWSATLAATIFADDPRRARAIAAAPLPAALEADDALQLARLRTLRSLVFLWETEGAAADLDAAFALLPTRLRAHDEAVETAALADALRGRGGDAAAARRAADAYRGLAERLPGPERARAGTNAAVLLAGLGELEAASEAFNAAVPHADEKARAFMLVAGAALDPTPDVIPTLDAVGESGSNASIRLLARAWRAEIARRAGDPGADALDEAYRAALARERENEIRGRMPTGRLGVVTTGDFNVNLNYTVRTGLAIQFTVHLTPWLIPPPPLVVADGGKAKGAAKAKSRAK